MVRYRQIRNYMTVSIKKGERGEGRRREGGGRGQEGAGEVPLACFIHVSYQFQQ